jgi:phage-related protein
MPALAADFLKLLQAVIPILPAVGSLATTFLKLGAGLIAQLLPCLVQLIAATAQLLVALLPILPPLIELIKLLVEGLLPPITGLIRLILEAGAAFIGNLVSGIVGAISHFTDLIKWLTDVITFIESVIGSVGKLGGAFESVFGAIPGFVSAAFSDLVGTVKGDINAVISLINGVIGAIDNVHVTIPSWVPGVGGPPTPGGTVVRVAEAGVPELVSPQSLLEQSFRNVLSSGALAGLGAAASRPALNIENYNEAHQEPQQIAADFAFLIKARG